MTIQQLLEVEEQHCPIPYPISDSETRARIDWARAGVTPVAIPKMYNPNAPIQSPATGAADNRQHRKPCYTLDTPDF